MMSSSSDVGIEPARTLRLNKDLSENGIDVGLWRKEINIFFSFLYPNLIDLPKHVYTAYTSSLTVLFPPLW
jgi:hypothetical protein